MKNYLNNLTKSIVPIIFFILIFSLFNSCYDWRTVEYRYFKKAQLDTRYEIEGRFQIMDGNRRDKMNYYLLKYNSKNKVEYLEYIEKGVFHHIDHTFQVARIYCKFKKGEEIRTFTKPYGEPMTNARGVYSEHLILNEEGYPKAVLSYDLEGNPMEDIYGVAKYKWLLDAEGRRIESTRYDLNGKQITDKSGIYKVRWEYDRYGNRVEMATYNADDQLYGTSDNSAIERWEYDRDGNVTAKKFYDTNSQLTELSDSGIAITRFYYDNRGNVLKRKYYGADEQLKANKFDNAAIIKFQYDKYDRVIEIRYFGADELPTGYKNSKYVRFTWEYNNACQRINIEKYDKYGNKAKY